ncbi:MAG: hypothetical protein V4722_27000 [Bacteroidota bacterium]
MKKILLLCILAATLQAGAQNVGIGTTAPATRLDIAGGNNWDLVNGEGDVRLGNASYRIKLGVALAGGGAGSGAIMQYGQPGGYNVLSIGSQGNYMLQLNGTLNRIGIGTDNPGGKLEIKTGSTTEPQLVLTQTTTTDYARLRMNIAGGRYWDIANSSTANSASDRFVFYNSATGNALTITGDKKVGIDNFNPNAPLAFAQALGKKITLYPGGTGDVGFGVSSNRLQIFSDNPNADVAIGYDVAGTFNERFAFKPNGALALNGNLGLPGQVLQSNGSAGATWSSTTNKLYNNSVVVKGTNSVNMSSYVLTEIPGFNYSFSTTGNAKVLVQFSVACYAGSCAFCGTSQVDLRFLLDGSDVSLHRYVVPNAEDPTLTGSVLLQVGGGNHSLSLRAATTGPAIFIGTTPSIFQNEMIVQVIPE